jgi:hypothetical protein
VSLQQIRESGKHLRKIVVTNFEMTGGIPSPTTTEGRAAGRYEEEPGATKPRPGKRTPGIDTLVLVTGYWLKKKMAYLEKILFLVLRERSPTVGLELERMEATEENSVGYRAARH